jgi:hypothetical protein
MLLFVGMLFLLNKKWLLALVWAGGSGFFLLYAAGQVALIKTGEQGEQGG